MTTPNRAPRTQVSDSRKGAYYFGLAISAVGLTLFLSTFLLAALRFGGHGTPFHPIQPVGGFILLIAGRAIASVARQGLAGSGVVLDPEKAREDQEPWSRMRGGMFQDTLAGAGVDLEAIGERLAGKGSPDEELPFDEKLRRLHALYQDGILSEEEYLREKQELLDRN